MIKRLQTKIVIVILIALFFVFAAVMMVLNFTVYRTSVKRANDFLTTIVENDGLFPIQIDTLVQIPDMNMPRPFSRNDLMRGGRFFYAKIDHSGNVFEENLLFMFGFDAEDAHSFIASALDSGRRKGSIDDFSFVVEEKPYGQIVAFIERSIDIMLIRRLNIISFWASGIVTVVLMCLSIFLAKWMVAPVKVSFEKQRRFISDASHELKTPLTIISTNVDVLENEIGENKRLTHIKAQAERMNTLIHDLLALAKADEGQENRIWNRFDLSGSILSTALEFESHAFEDGKQYSYDIEENISYFGDEKQIKQLVTILIDNAIRYSDENGSIKVSLQADGSHKRLSVFNTGVGVPENEKNKIFERFYRTDESRSRETGGYGVGLSIAKAITQAHKARITVSGEYSKWIRFDVIL